MGNPRSHACHCVLAALSLSLMLQLSLCRNLTHDNMWDYLILTHHWPQTVCIDAEIIKHEHECTIPQNVSFWTIHGLWPSQTGEKDKPVSCNGTWEFQESKIKPIEDMLLQDWTNYYTDSKKTSLWNHEWTKHGTCGTNVPLLKDEFHYFNETLNLAKQYNVTTWLYKEGISPSNDTVLKTSQFYDAVKKYTNYKPIMECTWHHKAKQQFIGQIFICLDKMFTPRECPPEEIFYRSINDKKSRRMSGLRYASFEPCRDSEDVIYPSIYHKPV